MKRDNSYGKEIICKRCSRRFIKSVSTGNICRPCRSQRYNKSYLSSVDKIESPKKRIHNSRIVNTSDNIEILNFVNKIDRRAGFLFSLTDLNDLLLHWYTITPVRSDRYDLQDVGTQLFNMWKDLLKFRDENNNINDSVKNREKSNIVEKVTIFS